MSVGYELKQQLEALIDYVYKDATEESDPKLKFYKYFKVEISDKASATFEGKYSVKTAVIKIANNPNAENANRYSTILHELSHHIQFKKYSWWNKEKKIEYLPKEIKGHGKEFYEIFEKLLHGAIDINLVTLEELRAMKHTASDYNKVMKMLDNYEPNEVDIPTDDTKRIYCYNSYNIKDDLKSNDYRYSKELAAWYKTLDGASAEEEKNRLLQLGMQEKDIIIKDGNKMLDMKPEVSKAQVESTFVIKYDFNKRYAVFTGTYSELEKLLKKNKYLSIKKVKDGESVTDLTDDLDAKGLEDTEYDDLVEYCNEHPSTEKKNK